MGDKHDEHASAARWSRIYEAMTGASAPPGPHDHDTDVPGAKPEAVTAGHEPDRFDARGIVMVPVVVVIMAFTAYVIVTLLFGHFEFGKLDTSKDAVQNQQAAEEGAKPYNERVTTISSTDPHAKAAEPRLEYMKKIDDSRNGKPSDPQYVRSFQPSESGNSPEMTPQDLDADRYTDPITGKKLLIEYEYVNKEKGIARIPIAEAMKAIKLPAKKATTNSSWGTIPKLSNGGQTPEAKKAEKETKH